MSNIPRPMIHASGSCESMEFEAVRDSYSCSVYEFRPEHYDYRSNLYEWFETQRTIRSATVRQRLSKHPHALSTVYFLRRPAHSGQESDLAHHVLGTAPDYEAVCRSSAATVTWLQETARFCFQTPQDDCNIDYTFGATIDSAKGFVCVLVSPDSPEELLDSLDHPSPPPLGAMTPLPILLIPIPLRVLQLHVTYTSSALAKLTGKVSKAEVEIMDPFELKDFDILIRDLHRYNADLMNLERRWHFERKLSGTIREVIERQKRDWVDCPDEKRDTFLRNFKRLDDDSMLQEKLSQASEYDLGVLPRRIQNQFTTVYNLMAQRDTKASLQDSSSMKTIAGMTLIFLPPTFICSFFSMSFFNFEATGAKSLWIYFAAAAPLTVLVTLSWIAYNTWGRKSGERRLKRKDASGHAV